MTTIEKTPEQLRAEADAFDQEAAASFERCDTDGFLSQWAMGLGASRKRMEATLAEEGGVSDFLALFTTDGEWVPAKMIQGTYGPRWMVLDHEGRRTGQYLNYHSVRRQTLAKHGFVEGYVTRPAHIDYVGETHTSVRPVRLPSDRPWDAPLAIVTADRWAEEGK